MKTTFSPIDNASKVMIAFMTAMFFCISAGLVIDSHKRHKKLANQEQFQKAKKQIHAKTFDLSKQK